MDKFIETKNSLSFKINTKDLNEYQCRLIKRVHSLLTEVMTTEFEDEYFDASSDLFKIVAAAVKASNFNEESTDINYHEQVLEFCADNLSDQVYSKSIGELDN